MSRVYIVLEVPEPQIHWNWELLAETPSISKGVGRSRRGRNDYSE